MEDSKLLRMSRKEVLDDGYYGSIGEFFPTLCQQLQLASGEELLWGPARALEEQSLEASDGLLDLFAPGAGQ
jgi:hypothetical protein